MRAPTRVVVRGLLVIALLATVAAASSCAAGSGAGLQRAEAPRVAAPSTAHVPFATGRETRVAQTVSVRILGGGPVRVEPRSVTVDIRGGHGELPEIRVIDPRGTLEGWTVVADADAEVILTPRPPSVVYGDAAGLRAGGSRADSDFVLGSAARGHGGGTYELGGMLRPVDTLTGPVTLQLQVIARDT